MRHPQFLRSAMDNEILKDARILIVDDEPANVRLLERLLRQGGYANGLGTTDPRQVLSLFAEQRPDLILLDLHMPHLDGFALLDKLRGEIPGDTYLPIMVLTADITPEAKWRALAAGAKDFLTKPFEQTEVLLRIGNLLETRFLHLDLRRHNERLEELVRERTRQLLQTEKLATMGQLLAGVAHELNNPLSVVIGQTRLLQQAAAAGPLAEKADKIVRAAERCGRIVKNFLALARQRPLERQKVRLNQIVREAAELLAYQLRVDNVEVQSTLAEDLPVLWADPHQLHQVVVNLVSNAHQAMRETPAPRRVTLATYAGRRGARVGLRVTDTGPGIPPEIQGRIFEPFFTTKPPGQGTGLGLSLCHGIVQSHGGSIRVESEPGGGATFVVELPVEAAPMPVPEAAPAEAPGDARRASVLVVDDEPDMADLLADILAAEGYRVETVPSGVAALEKLRATDFDLVISDLRMPELDGPGLYREVERRHPGLQRRFIFLTGDALNPRIKEFLENCGAPGLAKPFTLEDLRRAIQQVGGPPAGAAIAGWVGSGRAEDGWPT
jgi:signal transduction histidine kinase